MRRYFAANHTATRVAVRSLLTLLVLILCRALAGEPAQSNDSKPRFLINFAEFTEWPADAFANEHERLTIGILGEDPFHGTLDKLAADQVIWGRRIRILRFRKVDEIKLCHILYISESEGRRLDRVLRGLSGKSILTVSEIKNSAARGVMIEMKRQNKKIRLVINLESAKKAHLTLNPQLLRLGEIVESGEK